MHIDDFIKLALVLSLLLTFHTCVYWSIEGDIIVTDDFLMPLRLQIQLTVQSQVGVLSVGHTATLAEKLSSASSLHVLCHCLTLHKNTQLP